MAFVVNSSDELFYLWIFWLLFQLWILWMLEGEKYIRYKLMFIILMILTMKWAKYRLAKKIILCFVLFWRNIYIYFYCVLLWSNIRWFWFILPELFCHQEHHTFWRIEFLLSFFKMFPFFKMFNNIWIHKYVNKCVTNRQELGNNYCEIPLLMDSCDMNK